MRQAIAHTNERTFDLISVQWPVLAGARLASARSLALTAGSAARSRIIEGTPTAARTAGIGRWKRRNGRGLGRGGSAADSAIGGPDGIASVTLTPVWV